MRKAELFTALRRENGGQRAGHLIYNSTIKTKWTIFIQLIFSCRRYKLERRRIFPKRKKNILPACEYLYRMQHRRAFEKFSGGRKARPGFLNVSVYCTGIVVYLLTDYAFSVMLPQSGPSFIVTVRGTENSNALIT